MTAKGARTARRRRRLDRDRVLRAAMALADAGGLESLTMAKVGRRLGVEAMSLYRHVRDKADLLDGIVDLVHDEIELPPPDSGWREALRGRALSARVVLVRHPWAIGIMESRRQPGPATLRHLDAVVGVLRRSGFSSATATHATNLLDSYIYGFAIQEASLPFSDAAELADVGREMLEQVPADTYPDLVAVASELLEAGFDYGAEFEVGLDLILDGIERAWGVSASRSPAGRSGA